MATEKYEVQPNDNESIHGFNTLCRKISGTDGRVECIPRNGGDYQEVVADGQAVAFDDLIPGTKPFWESHPVEIFMAGCALGIIILAWWVYTRRPALRNNILIGGATIGAFCLNPIAGAIVLAAWIFSSRIGRIESPANDA